MKHVQKAVAALAVAVGSMAVTVPTASADWSTADAHYWTTKYESVYVNEAGDRFTLCKLSNDTVRPYFSVDVRHNNGTWYRMRLIPGSAKKGSCTTVAINVLERHSVRVNMRGRSGIASHTFFNDH